ncbi:MAG: glycosyltransferase family 1 protein [Thermoflexales bacterium]|nr:glycosyltransferase family 1 protein [Thermoflexales bacterium]
MRIALVTETFLPRVDGVTNTLCRLLEHLALRGYETLLFAPAGAPPSYARTPIIALDGWRFAPYPEFKLISPFAPIAEPMRVFAPDVVHVLNPITLGAAAIWHARRMRIPVVASYHTDVPGFMARWGYRTLGKLFGHYLRWVHNMADLNLCPSTVTLEALRKQGYRNLRVWGRGVDTALFNPQKRSAEMRARLSNGDVEAPLLLFVGRLSHEKRVDWIRDVLDALPQTRLAVVGDGPARPALERVFAGASAIFTGALRGEALAAAYASADIFVFPAPNETLGNVVLEAMASALPVVAPRAGGLLDHAVDGETAVLFDPEDRTALVKSVARLIEDPALARRLGQAGWARVQTRTWSVVLDKLLEEYERMRRSDHPRSAMSPQWNV